MKEVVVAVIYDYNDDNDYDNDIKIMIVTVAALRKSFGMILLMAQLAHGLYILVDNDSGQWK